MRITFLMPCFAWGPSGGFRIVYEYANRLVARGHQVTVVHPRRLKYPPPEKLTLRKRARKLRLQIKETFLDPVINWHSIDKRVDLRFVASSDQRCIPDGDVLFATAWHTVRSVLACSQAKGQKCYFIQGYETWQGPQHLVDQTWRAPLRKIVISRWLLELGRELGCDDIAYIPNGIDFQKYRLILPIENRPGRVVMPFSPVPIKGSADGIRALEIAKKEFPDLQVVLFGISRPPSFVPAWMTYFHDPPQSTIVEQLYNYSSVLLSPSWTEGFALPPAEAAACGCAIVGTDIGALQEYVKNGISGLLSPPKNPEALAANLCRLLGDDGLRVRLARAGKTSVAEFDWTRSADLLEDFLHTTVWSDSLPEPSGRLDTSLEWRTIDATREL